MTQRQDFLRYAGCRRLVYNWGLSQKMEGYRQTGRSPSHVDLSKQLVALKHQPEKEFLLDCSSQMLQQSLVELERDFIRFYKGEREHPLPKSRKRTPHSFRFTQNLSVSSGSVRLPKLGWIKAKIHREIEGKITGAVVKLLPGEQWYIFIFTAFDKESGEPSCIHPAGIDLGLDNFITFDDGEKIKAPRFYRKKEAKIKRFHRILSRRKKGGRNHHKARKQLSALYLKARNRRNDWLHKLSADITSCHDTICIESLKLSALAKTKLSKSFNDAGHGGFVRMLEYKGLWYGCQVVKIDRYFPSTKACYECGHRETVGLSDRTWQCSGCGAAHDRDVNAAKNILREGLRIVADGQSETLNACGEEVRLAAVSIPRRTKKVSIRDQATSSRICI